MCCAAKMPFAPDNGYGSLEVVPSPTGARQKSDRGGENGADRIGIETGCGGEFAEMQKHDLQLEILAGKRA